MQRKYQDNYFTTVSAEINLKKYVTIFGILLLFGIFLGFVPLLFKAIGVQKIDLMPGSEIRQFYTKIPFPIDFKVYLFNVTNKDEVTNGAKPMVQEIGPYVFEEWKEKLKLSDNENDDTLTFYAKNTFIFRPDLSNGLTGNEIITTVHPLIMGIALSVNIERKGMLPLAINAINAIFHEPKDPFWTGRVMDYLFDGIEIDCTSDKFEAKAVCSIFESGDYTAIQPLREDFFKFSLLGAVNGSEDGMYKVFRGIKNFRDVGRIISFNNETEMNVWEGDECNQYKGTDSTIFPPGLIKDDYLWVYEPNLCLSMGAYYERDSNYQGIPTIRFGFDFGDVRKDDTLKCYCLDAPEGCPRQGTMNLFRCLGAPLVLSLPHFYKGDPTLLTQIESGLNPNENDHAFYIEYEESTGSQTKAAKRLQFNLDIVPIPQVEYMKNLSKVVMPLIWVEESAPVNETYLNMKLNILKYQLFLIAKILQWIAVITGAAGIMFSGYIYYNNQNATFIVAPIKGVDERMADKVSNADKKVCGKLDPVKLTS